VRETRTDIFVVDDDELFRFELANVLEREGCSVEAFGNLNSCRSAMKDRSPSVILLDIQLPDGNGVEFLREVVSDRQHPEVIMVSGAASLQEAADSMKIGAADFIEKPFEPPRLLSVVNSCLRIARLKEANARLLESRLKEYEIVGASDAMERLRGCIEQIAATDTRVLITGESGTGKELVAGQMHYLSRRSAAPFVKLNCSALPSELVESELFGHEKGAFTGAIRSHKGRFVQAHSGTLLLDEIADMPIAIQPKLLRVIETAEVEPVGGRSAIRADTRIVSSTNQDLEKLAHEGKFRADLLYRINTVPIQVPPLREHTDDIPQLINHFLERLLSDDPATVKELDSNAIDVLMLCDWPGNVRQLRNVIERLFYMTPDARISADAVRACLGDRDMPNADAFASASEGQNRLAAAVSRFEHGFLKLELEKAGGNVARLAERLGMDRGNLYRKLKKMDLLSS
jgi:two-component system nitrogen regulation response regulator NtrX